MAGGGSVREIKSRQLIFSRFNNKTLISNVMFIKPAIRQFFKVQL